MKIRKVAVGNAAEAFIEGNFTNGVNIISSDDNNKGKTIVIQSMMYALGNEPTFPTSFEFQKYYYYIEFEEAGIIFKLCRSGDGFVLKRESTVLIFDNVSELKRYWNRNIFPLPSIAKNQLLRIVDPVLYVQLFFIGQDKKDTSNIANHGFYNKQDFIDMLYAYAGLIGEQLPQERIDEIKSHIITLSDEKKLLLQQHKILKSKKTPVSYLSAESDRLAFGKKIESLERVQNKIAELRKARNSVSTRKSKWEHILTALRDIAYNLTIFEAVKQENVTRESLMRDLGSRIIREQFHRIANGGAKLTPFDISYKLPGQVGTDYQLEFHVVPDSNPPTNIHVLIGRNGVGKTHMLTSMIRCLSTGNQDGQYGKFSFEHRTKFSNFVCVAFSPFDTYPMPDDIEEDEYSGKYTYIGLGSGQEIRMQRLEEQFIAALRSCNKYKEKRTLWIATMTLLNSDPIFANNGASALLSPQGTEEGELVVSAQELFSRLSSGHKVILLTLTCLVAITMERTLVLMDEPENHLHPPLLSAFVRALSALLIQKNGLAIISTHSPVILQEVPKNCIWQLYRNNTILRAVRPERETFGENVGVLINDVFGLEVTHSGFHGMLLQMVEAGLTYEEILNKFDFRVGMEARSILRILLANREYGGTE